MKNYKIEFSNQETALVFKATSYTFNTETNSFDFYIDKDVAFSITPKYLGVVNVT